MCAGAGIDILFKRGGQNCGVEAGVAQFADNVADNVALFPGSRSEFKMAARTLVDVARKLGLTVSTHKSKGIVVR